MQDIDTNHNVLVNVPHLGLLVQWWMPVIELGTRRVLDSNVDLMRLDLLYTGYIVSLLFSDMKFNMLHYQAAQLVHFAALQIMLAVRGKQDVEVEHK